MAQQLTTGQATGRPCADYTAFSNAPQRKEKKQQKKKSLEYNCWKNGTVKVTWWRQSFEFKENDTSDTARQRGPQSG